VNGGSRRTGALPQGAFDLSTMVLFICLGAKSNERLLSRGRLRHRYPKEGNVFPAPAIDKEEGTSGLPSPSRVKNEDQHRGPEVQFARFQRCRPLRPPPGSSPRQAEEGGAAGACRAFGWNDLDSHAQKGKARHSPRISRCGLDASARGDECQSRLRRARVLVRNRRLGRLHENA